MVAGQHAKLPKLKDHKVLALDIGTRFIKASELRLYRGVISLLNVVVCPTPPDALDKSLILDPTLLGQAVHRLLATNKITTRSVVVSIRGQSSVVVRPIELPKMSKKELAETMKFEVERHVPFAANEVVMDYAPLIDPEDLPENEENMKVLLAVAQEELIKSYLKVLKVAKLTPVAFDVEILSAVRALVDIHQDESDFGQTVALVSIGASSTDISIVHEGNLVFNRSVPIAGDALSNAIAEQLGRSFEEAEELKIEHGKVFIDSALGELPVPGDQVSTETVPEASSTPSPAPFFSAFDHADSPMDATISWQSSGPMPQQVFSLDESFDTAGPLTLGEAEPAPPAAPPAAESAAAAAEVPPAADAVSVSPAAAVEDDDSQQDVPVFHLGDDEDAAPPAPAPAAPPASNGFGGPVFDISSEIEGQLPPQRPRFTDDASEDDTIFTLGDAPPASAAPAGMSQPLPGESAATSPTPPAATSYLTPSADSTAAETSWHDGGNASQDELFQRRIFEAMLPTLGELVTEIQRSLEFYSSREPDNPISRILLYGGASRLPRLGDFIHQEVGVDVQSADPLQALETTLCQLPADYLQDLAPALPVSIGLGLRDMLA